MRNLFTWTPLYAAVGIAICFIEPIRVNLLFGALVLGGIISMFAFFGYFGNPEKRREVADNCYLLGFLFTLAMVVATLQGLGSQEIRSVANELLSAIGIAMATSVIGMVLRIVILDRHFEPADHLTKEYRIVADRLQELASSMEDSKAAAESYRNDLAELSESTRLYRRNLVSEAENLGGMLDRHTAQVAKTLGGSIAESLDLEEFGKARQQITDATKFISPITREIADNMRAMGDAIDRMQLKFSSSYAADLASRLESIGRSMAEMENAVGNLASTARDTVADLQGLGSELVVSTQSNLVQLRKQALADLEEIGKLKESYRNEFEKASREALAETHKLYASLIAGADLVLSSGDKAGAIADDIRRIANQLEKQGKDQ
ncbi:MAG: hypothetical protein OXC81_05175 [Betaproteobacteria bacterium]|nr:hypothetical protein [Betaproteobacteria bacterium]